MSANTDNPDGPMSRDANAAGSTKAVNATNDANADIESLAREAVRGVSRNAFAVGFESRAWVRWSSERSGANLVSLVERSARRLIPFALAASLLLALYSTKPTTQVADNRTIIERMLGWSAPTHRSVYDVYGLAASAETTHP